jgi:hypothetical protein
VTDLPRVSLWLGAARGPHSSAYSVRLGWHDERGVWHNHTFEAAGQGTGRGLPLTRGQRFGLRSEPRPIPLGVSRFTT